MTVGAVSGVEQYQRQPRKVFSQRRQCGPLDIAAQNQRHHRILLQVFEQQPGAPGRRREIVLGRALRQTYGRGTAGLQALERNLIGQRGPRWRQTPMQISFERLILRYTEKGAGSIVEAPKVKYFRLEADQLLAEAGVDPAKEPPVAETERNPAPPPAAPSSAPPAGPR